VRDMPQDPVTAKPMTEGDKKVGNMFRILMLIPIHIPCPTSHIQDSCSMLYCST
jgi:hypothetical protein